VQPLFYSAEASVHLLAEPIDLLVQPSAIEVNLLIEVVDLLIEVVDLLIEVVDPLIEVVELPIDPFGVHGKSRDAVRQDIQFLFDPFETLFRHAILRGGTTTLASSASIRNRNDDAARVFEDFLVRVV